MALDKKRENVKHRMIFFSFLEQQVTVRRQHKLRDNTRVNFTYFYKKKKHTDKT